MITMPSVIDNFYTTTLHNCFLFIEIHLKPHRDSVGSTGLCVKLVPCSWQPDSAERNTEWCRCCRYSWCRRWPSTSPQRAARLLRLLCSTPVGCCSLAARGSVSRLRVETDVNRISNETMVKTVWHFTLEPLTSPNQTWTCGCTAYGKWPTFV